jgi:hypothetical protein
MSPRNTRSFTCAVDALGELAAHRYARRAPEGEIPDLPPIDSLRFEGAGDVVALAEVDRCIGWKTWPEVWHLHGEGKFCCYYKASSLDSIRAWADDPAPLHRSRSEGLRSREGCTTRWLIVDSRPAWRHPPPVVDNVDLEAFTRLRREMATIGITLLDAVVFDDDGHWWSLHELTTGTTTWAKAGIERS